MPAKSGSQTAPPPNKASQHLSAACLRTGQGACRRRLRLSFSTEDALLDALNSLEDRLKLMRDNMHLMTQMTPWARRLGFRITRIERAQVWGVQPWSDAFSGDPDTGVIHGGVITSFLDNLSGMACGAALEKFRAVATLDLRIDYMRPADQGRDIIGEAHCYNLTRTIAFTHAWAYHESRDKVIATASAAFAINKIRAPSSAGSF